MSDTEGGIPVESNGAKLCPLKGGSAYVGSELRAEDAVYAVLRFISSGMLPELYAWMLYCIPGGPMPGMLLWFLRCPIPEWSKGIAGMVPAANGLLSLPPVPCGAINGLVFMVSYPPR